MVSEVHLVGLNGEIDKLVILFSNGMIVTYSYTSGEAKELEGPYTRFGAIQRKELLEDVDREMGYVEEKLKALRRVKVMLSKAEERGDGH